MWAVPTSTSWAAADGAGTAQVDATTSIAPADLVVVDVLTASGQRLVQLDAPQPNN